MIIAGPYGFSLYFDVIADEMDCNFAVFWLIYLQFSTGDSAVSVLLCGLSALPCLERSSGPFKLVLQVTCVGNKYWAYYGTSHVFAVVINYRCKIM